MKNWIKNKGLIGLIFLFIGQVYAQTPKPKVPGSSAYALPKLVIGIVVDQMRYDYINRFWDKFGDGGFKLLVNNGFYCKNTNYNYVPTYTGPGHASIYSGTSPAIHGIVANEWYDKQSAKMIYCTQDNTVKTVGAEGNAGLMSPKNMFSTTIGDELQMHYMMKPKVIGVALKDRGSIIPAGHAADGAYWFDGKSGKFISSDFYMKALPEWVNDFNKKELPISYLKRGWNTMLPIDQYTESLKDDTPYEKPMNGQEKPVFPYSFEKQLSEKDYEVIRSSPLGNKLTLDFALAALQGENLGGSSTCDMLCVSFSSTDYVGHAYGPKSIEIEDIYLRLDKDIAALITAAEKKVGKGNFVLFLTADHGAAEVPSFLNDIKIPGGYIESKKIVSDLKSLLFTAYQDSLILNASNQQLFLNHGKITEKKIDRKELNTVISNYLLKINGISEVYFAEDIKTQTFEKESLTEKLQKGFNQKRSGDVLIRFQPGWIEYMPKGTTHGAEYTYDTRVPLLFYGFGVNKGSSFVQVSITDIAPTICAILDIPFPNGCTGKPILEVLKK